MSITVTWFALPVDPVLLDVGGVAAADQVPAVEAGAVEPAQERADGAAGDVAAPVRRVVLEVAGDQLAELVERVNGGRRAERVGQPDRGGEVWDVLGEALELLLDAGDQVGDLAALVALLGEQEAQQPVADDVADRPEVRGHADVAAAGVGHRDVRPALDGRPEPDRLERPGRQPERRVVGAVARRSAARWACRGTAGPRP